MNNSRVLKIFDSDSLYRLRGIAILTVIVAHCTYNSKSLQTLADIIGTIGVPVFLVLNGFFINMNQNVEVFIKTKFKKIVVPWIVWSVITYGVLILAGGKTEITVIDFLKWMIGYKTWLYYVPIMLINMIIIIMMRNQKKLLYATLCFSILSNILTIIGIDIPIITNYQNPFNWTMFMIIGVLLRKQIEQKEYKLPTKKKNTIFFLTLLFICFISMSCIYFIYSSKTNIKPSYWTVVAIPFELLSLGTLYVLCKYLFKLNILKSIGKHSYVIYFSHMQIGLNITELIFKRLILASEFVTFIATPIIIVLLTEFAVLLAKRIPVVRNYTWILGF